MAEFKKMGRPPKGGAPRNKRLELRVTEEHLDRLNKIAQGTGLTRSDLVVEGIEKIFKKYE